MSDNFRDESAFPDADETAELEDRIDCLQKSVANLRNDILTILDEKLDKLVLSILKEERAKRREARWS